MKSILEKLSGIYFYLKSRKILKRISAMLDFPAKAKEIDHVLIVLPRGLEHLDDANQFVQKLRKNYRNWSVEIFDADKISPSDLNLLKLPNQNVIKKLKRVHYNLAIDLNVQFDLVSVFIAVMSEAKYRIAFSNHEQHYFNLQCSPARDSHNSYFQPLFDYLNSLFIKR